MALNPDSFTRFDLLAVHVFLSTVLVLELGKIIPRKLNNHVVELRATGLQVSFKSFNPVVSNPLAMWRNWQTQQA